MRDFPIFAEKSIMPHLIAPSILSADFLNLGDDLEMINNSKADWFHVDIMDGVFVPNISIGFPVLKYIQKVASKPLDVHLMIVNPERYFERFRDAGAEILSIHYEGCTHLHRSVHAIRELDMKAGVVLNPHTPVALLNDIINDLDLVVLMAVNPGYGGQAFIEQTYSKASQLKELILQKSASALIEVDGGVTLENAGKLIDCGIDVLVAGHTVFSSDDPVQTIEELKTIR